jgi:hypothetical protein
LLVRFGSYDSPVSYARGQQITDHERRKAGGRTCHTIGLDGGRRMLSLPLLCRRILREKASAYRFWPGAIPATVAGSQLPGQSRSRACKHSSTARKARNVRRDVSGSFRRPIRRWEQAGWSRGETGIVCRLPAIQKTRRNLDSRILAEDLGPWRFSLSSKMMLPHTATRRAAVPSIP